MLEASLRRITSELPEDALVLDIGGWAKPLARADWVIDLLPYETRGLYGIDGEPGTERFSAQTWVTRDICAREPWPFAADQFDFVVCSHTLEDVRDPVWVCQEISRVARAGYVEVPAIVEELTWGVQGPWVGWGHHHWLCEVGPDRIDFVFKPHLLPRKESHLPPGSCDGLTAAERVQTLWWEGELVGRERLFIGADEFDPWLDALVRSARPAGRPGRLRRLLS